jgi:hypothetical protein
MKRENLREDGSPPTASGDDDGEGTVYDKEKRLLG